MRTQTGAVIIGAGLDSGEPSLVGLREGSLSHWSPAVGSPSRAPPSPRRLGCRDPHPDRGQRRERQARAALDAAQEALVHPMSSSTTRRHPTRRTWRAQRVPWGAWAVNVVGALTAAAHVAPLAIANGGGSIIITGGLPSLTRTASASHSAKPACVRRRRCSRGHTAHPVSTWRR